MSAGKKLPRQDILEIDKTPKWFSQHLDFADDLLRNSDIRVQKMNRLYNGYNGVVHANSVKYLTDTYGWKNRNKYIDYRVARTKIDILHGELLKIPLRSTIKTTNSQAKLKKQAQYDFNLGAAYAKPHIDKLRSIGIDPLEGMQPEDPNDPQFKQKITPKDRYEIIMQRIINSLIEDLSLVEKFGSNFLDGEITSREFSRITVDEKNGNIDLEPIDPRDGVFFEFDKDPFLKKSFLMGCRKKVPVNEVLMKYDLTDEERTKLESIRDNFDDYNGNADYKGKYSIVNGQNVVTITHIEWMGMQRKYSKKSPKTKSQMELSSPEDGMVTLNIMAKDYESNKAARDKSAEKNGQQYITEFTEEVYEATRIGHDLDIRRRLKPFVIKDEDTGSPQLSYTGVVIKAVDGEAISLQELIENFSNQYNIVMYQILREIGKVKGKGLAFDRGMLPKGVNPKKMLYRMLNDSLIDFSSAGNSNMAGKDMDIHKLIQEYDLGLSASFPHLINFKNDIVMTLNYITGINNERTGDIQASSTVTNAMASLEASRTITESLFFYHHKYCEHVITKLAETAKIVYGLYKPEKLRILLGDDDFDYLTANPELAYQNYSAFLTNGRLESQLKEKIERYAEAYANAKELRFQDLIEVVLSDSLADSKRIVQEGWNTVERIRQMETDKQLMAQNENGTRQSETQLQLMREDREDRQTHEMNKIMEQGRVDMIVNTADQKGRMILEQNIIDNENINNQDITKKP